MSGAGMPSPVSANAASSAPSPAPVSVSPCGACKFLRRKCTNNCIFAPYFPPDQSARFANVHKIFGASNVGKLLQDLPVQSREDAVNSLSYEADARINDPVYGCVGALFSLQQQVAGLQAELALAQAELSRLHALSGQAQVAAAAVAAAAAGAGGPAAAAAMNQFMPVVQAASAGMVMPYGVNGAVLGQPPPSQGGLIKPDYDSGLASLHQYSPATQNSTLQQQQQQQSAMASHHGGSFSGANGSGGGLSSMPLGPGGGQASLLGSGGKHQSENFSSDAIQAQSGAGGMQQFPVGLGMVMAMNGGQGHPQHQQHQPHTHLHSHPHPVGVGGGGMMGVGAAGFVDAIGFSGPGHSMQLSSQAAALQQHSLAAHSVMSSQQQQQQSMSEDGIASSSGGGGGSSFS